MKKREQNKALTPEESSPTLLTHGCILAFIRTSNLFPTFSLSPGRFDYAPRPRSTREAKRSSTRMDVAILISYLTPGLPRMSRFRIKTPFTDSSNYFVIKERAAGGGLLGLNGATKTRTDFASKYDRVLMKRGLSYNRDDVASMKIHSPRVQP